MVFSIKKTIGYAHIAACRV